MSLQAIANFIEIRARSGAIQGRYQNGKVEAAIALDGKNYSFLSFFYKGATRTRTGDNLQAQLVLATNPLPMNIAVEAVDRDWFVQVTTCAMDPRTFTVGRKLTSEIWQAAGLSYDTEALTITLSSAIDAVGARVPNRVLTTKLAGALPTTGSIQSR